MKNITITRKPVELKKTTRHGLDGQYSAKYWKQRYSQLKGIQKKYEDACDELAAQLAKFEKLKQRNTQLSSELMEANGKLIGLTRRKEKPYQSVGGVVYPRHTMTFESKMDRPDFKEFWAPQDESPKAIRERTQQ